MKQIELTRLEVPPKVHPSGTPIHPNPRMHIRQVFQEIDDHLHHQTFVDSLINLRVTLKGDVAILREKEKKGSSWRLRDKQESVCLLDTGSEITRYHMGCYKNAKTLVEILSICCQLLFKKFPAIMGA